jgi:hypothetical protein
MAHLPSLRKIVWLYGDSSGSRQTRTPPSTRAALPSLQQGLLGFYFLLKFEQTRVNVIIIFYDFRQVLRKYRCFLKNNVMIKFLHNLVLFLVKSPIFASFLAKIF